MQLRASNAIHIDIIFNKEGIPTNHHSRRINAGSDALARNLLKINRLGYPRGRQKSLFPDIRAKDHLMNDIKQLELRLGNPQVYTVKEVEPWSRIPERRYALTPTGR